MDFVSLLTNLYSRRIIVEMDKVCNGSGRPTYYRYKGRKLLLCGTLVPHVHCECGNPLPGAKAGDHCRTCNQERARLSVHTKDGHIRETREHLDTTENSEARLGALDRNLL